MKEAHLKIQFILPLKVELSSFCFKLPAEFYPNYEKMGAPSPITYLFGVELSIKSSKKIT